MGSLHNPDRHEVITIARQKPSSSWFSPSWCLWPSPCRWRSSPTRQPRRSTTTRWRASLARLSWESSPFQAPDTGDAVYKLTYTADMDGFQAMGDHLPVSVIMDPVPEVELPAMVDYTPEVAAARADFLKVQEEIMAKHAAEENMVEMEETEMERKKREADPVVVPTHTNLLPTTYHHLAGAYPVYYNNPYLTYPIHQVRAPIVSQPVYTVANNFPVYRILPQVATDVSATIAEGDDEPAALAL